MDQLVFQNPEAATYFNSTFINLKLHSDSSKFDNLYQKYNIYGLPTTIILSPEGNEIDRIIGFKGKEKFLQTIKDYVNGINTLAAFLEQEKQNPSDIELLFKIAYKYADRQENEKALNYFSKVVEMDAKRESAFIEEASFNIALFKTKIQKNEEPLVAYLKNCKSAEYKEKTYNQLIRFHKRQKKPEKVLALYEEAISVFPENTSMMNGYAWYIFTQKIPEKYTRGIAVAQRAVELKPDQDGIWDTLAQLHYANGNTNKAIKAMEKAVALAPKTESYQKLLAKYKKS